MKFDYALDFKRTDFRAHPELYRVGRGENCSTQSSKTPPASPCAKSTAGGTK